MNFFFLSYISTCRRVRLVSPRPVRRPFVLLLSFWSVMSMSIVLFGVEFSIMTVFGEPPPKKER